MAVHTLKYGCNPQQKPAEIRGLLSMQVTFTLTLTLRADPQPENERTRRLYDTDTSPKSPGHSTLLPSPLT